MSAPPPPDAPHPAEAERPSDTLARLRPAWQAELQQHGATGLRAFGALARGEDAPGSEIDLLVDHPDIGFDPTPLRAALERLIGVRVDLVALPQVAGAVREQLLGRSRPL